MAALDDGNDGDDALARFLPPVAAWFRHTLGEPTPAQRLGWPAIAAGRNTLIVAPTGSGKTLAAFLAALDLLWRAPRREAGVRILYISPLKALNEDIRRNLEIPLAGILERSQDCGPPLSPLQSAVRSGDTPARDRARMVRKPPDILITTPESLHLMLTSRAREILRGVSHVIIDEIHAVCGNKRGVFLALLLERLEAISKGSFLRVGLSATQRPLEEVARYLGGQRCIVTGPGERRFEARAVTIIDAGRRKTMDLKVIWPGPDDGRYLGPPGTIWPAIEERILGLIDGHRSTIVFTNNRRTVEKLTSRLNETVAAVAAVETEPDSEAEGHPDSFRAHHGSLSLEERRTTEEELKSGALRGVVSTASLELGIDMGEVDLVCQVESPGNIARGLQRVGRAGHVVHGVSKGRLIAKTAGDLLETAALARAMVEGNIEQLRVPHGCLDVLAQQVVACVALDRWNVPDLFDLVRRAYPFEDMEPEVFERVLCLVSGRFPTGSLRDLRARIAWDRIHNRLAALPGSARLALVGGGTIPDTGQYPVYLGAEGPRLGELDEEFVFERRVGEAFALGNNTWRIDAIEAHRVVVRPAEGNTAVMPFWRGEKSPRSAELGAAVGTLCREIAGRLEDPELPRWLEEECQLEARATRPLIRYIARQARVAGVVPDDRTILVETFRDPAGELGLAVLSPFGGRMHQGLKLALLGRIRERYGIQASCLHGDDGLLIRLPGMEDPALDLLDGLTADEAERLIRLELPETALYGLRFRQNAARALLMPRPDPAKRTPLWLQRLRAKDLLQVVGKFPDFPIVVETFRECLDQDLELSRLRWLFEEISAEKVRIVTRQGEIASPFASELIFQFTPSYLYQWDEPRRGDLRPGGPAVDEDLLDALLEAPRGARLLDPQAVGRVESRLRRRGLAPRTAEEMAETLRTLGDLSSSELFGPSERLLEKLRQDGRAVQIDLPETAEPVRWILAEDISRYRRAFPAKGDHDLDDVGSIVRRYLRTHAMSGMAELCRRYPIAPELAAEMLDQWVEKGGLIRLAPADPEAECRWAEPENLAEIHRLSVAIRRRESVAVAPEVFADFLLRRQHLHPATRLEGPGGLEAALEQLQGYAAAAEFWESEILPRRVQGYRAAWLDDLLATGCWLWRAANDGRDEPSVTFVPRDFAGDWHCHPGGGERLPDERQVLDVLTGRGASFATDLARASGLEPSRLRRALRDLMLRGEVTNDRFEPLRNGAFDMIDTLVDTRASGSGRLNRVRPRRASGGRAEGRWVLLEPADQSEEDRRLVWLGVLLERYGILTRELVELDPWAPAWADLAGLLARAELRGELRRGYFVEGFSGVQYARDEAAEGLSRLAGSLAPADEDILLAAADPANLYGSGAPLDIPLLDGGTGRLSRVAGNYIVMKNGRPVLVMEARGKRLTGLASASRPELHAALARLVELVGPGRQILKVETYNGEPALQSSVATRLAELGFVRDYPGMTYYGAWAKQDTQSPANAVPQGG
jgi:ATP-dependent helicase Lhr and Lhr-like helicase